MDDHPLADHTIDMKGKGCKAMSGNCCSETYDLLYRREVDAPNAVWQADHTLLDLLVLDDKGAPTRPWLSVIVDDYSRAIAGYFLSFNAPAALQTALALHQAIWRKSEPGWTVCGIPAVLYVEYVPRNIFGVELNRSPTRW